ncbi:MAG: histidine kinase dimerization/phospho-acceptor domain-containing protein [Rubrivivax sp.]
MHEAVRSGARLAANAAAERAFSAHAAHALRTPLAGLEAQLAVAQREAPPALQGRLARMRGATTRLSHVVTALLALFRSGSELKRVPVDVEVPSPACRWRA